MGRWATLPTCSSCEDYGCEECESGCCPSCGGLGCPACGICETCGTYTPRCVRCGGRSCHQWELRRVRRERTILRREDVDVIIRNFERSLSTVEHNGDAERRRTRFGATALMGRFLRMQWRTRSRSRTPPPTPKRVAERLVSSDSPHMIRFATTAVADRVAWGRSAPVGMTPAQLAQLKDTIWASWKRCPLSVAGAAALRRWGRE